MAIDQRQIMSINFPTGFTVDPIVQNDDIQMSSKFNNDDSLYHVTFSLPEKFIRQPEFYEPEPEPSPSLYKGALSDYTVDEILTIVRSGEAPDYWQVGNSIAIPMSAFRFTNDPADTTAYGIGSAIVSIIGFDHNRENETPGYAHTMTFACMKKSAGSTVVTNNASTDLPIAFSSAAVRADKTFNAFENNFYNALPSDWKEAIINVQKTGVYGQDTSNCKVFQLSYYEAYGDSADNVLNHITSEFYQNGRQQQYKLFQETGFPSVFGVYLGWSAYTDQSQTVSSRDIYEDKTNSCVTLRHGVMSYLTDVEGSKRALKTASYGSPYLYFNLASSNTPSWMEWEYGVQKTKDVIVTPRAAIIPCFTIG